jgi:STE24 endopeptidase
MYNTYFIIILSILVFGFLLERILDHLNFHRWKSDLLEKLASFYSKEEYKKAYQYNKTKDRFSLLTDSLSFIIMILFFVLGGFAWLNGILEPGIDSEILLALAFFGILFIASDLISIPFSIYNTFVIEEKFGFNKTTPRIFVFDKLKSYLLTIVIGGGISYVLLWLISELREDFWLYAFLVVLAFSILMNFFYTTLILPLFNKLKPLEEGELKSAIEDFASKVKFPLTKVFVIDGSKRSSKANAFFSGFGRKKKIVLYDTLIEKHTTEELVAVLAHEVGHFKKKHIIKNMVVSFLQTFVMLYILSLLLFHETISVGLTNAFGLEGTNAVLHINLIAIAILFEPVNLILGLFGNIVSRKYEFQADRFAVENSNGEALASALKKMSAHHLSNLDPHPAYVFFYYSHPPLIQRLEEMNS